LKANDLEVENRIVKPAAKSQKKTENDRGAEVVDLYRARDHRLKVTVKQTQVSVTEDTYEKVSKAAATRGCSMNSIVNSALVAFLRKSANSAAFRRRNAEEM